MTESIAQRVARRLRTHQRILLLALAAQEQPIRASLVRGGELVFSRDMFWPLLPGPPTAAQLAELGPLLDFLPCDEEVEIHLSMLGVAVAQRLV